MSYPLPNAPPPLDAPPLAASPLDTPPRPRRWLERLLLAAFLICLLVGLGALAAFFVLRNAAQPSTNVNALDAVRTELILPQFALRELAGDDAAGLATQLQKAGHLESARAALTYAADMPGVEWAARLTALGRAYLAAGEGESASQVANLAVAVAILDDAIPLLERVSVLTQSAEILHRAGFTAAAIDAATQALRIAAQAPTLLPAQRSTLFNELRKVIEPFAEDSAASATLWRTVNDYARNPYLIGAGVLVTPTMATFPQPIAYDSPTQEKIVARQEAARLLADRILLTGGVDIEPERQGLVQALLAEEQARASFYANPGEISRGQQLWLLLDRRAWLITKLRIAMQGFGLALVPEWESIQPALRAEVAAANGYLDTVMAAYANDQIAPLAKAMLQIETQHWQALQAARGLYPDAPLANIGELLRSVQDELMRQGSPLALPLVNDPAAQPPGFRIQPAP